MENCVLLTLLPSSQMNQKESLSCGEKMQKEKLVLQ